MHYSSGGSLFLLSRKKGLSNRMFSTPYLAIEPVGHTYSALGHSSMSEGAKGKQPASAVVAISTTSVLRSQYASIMGRQQRRQMLREHIKLIPTGVRH